MPFRSKRQWRFAFATGQPWARRWARETPGGAGDRFRALPEAKAQTDEGAAAPARGRVMTPAERARNAALVRWGKKNPLMARQLALREKRRAARAKPDPEKAERDKARLAAAMGREAARARRDAEREKAKADRAASLRERMAAGLGKGEKPKRGGGGGGGGKPTPEDKDKARQADRERATAEAVRAAGLKPSDLDDLRAAAEQGGVASPALRRLGLVGEDGQTTDQGRRALAALERGDVRGYRAALQDAAAAQGRARDRAGREAERARGRADREQARADAERQAAADARAEDEALLADFEAGRQGLTMAQQRRLRKAGLIEYDERGNIRRVSATKHGAHDQSTHGRRTARRRAYSAAYRSARAGGADPATARQVAREAGLARQSERDARLARMRAAQGGTQNAPTPSAPQTPADIRRAAATAPQRLVNANGSEITISKTDRGDYRVDRKSPPENTSKDTHRTEVDRLVNDLRRNDFATANGDRAYTAAQVRRDARNGPVRLVGPNGMEVVITQYDDGGGYYRVTKIGVTPRGSTQYMSRADVDSLILDAQRRDYALKGADARVVSIIARLGALSAAHGGSQ